MTIQCDKLPTRNLWIYVCIYSCSYYDAHKLLSKYYNLLFLSYMYSNIGVP